VRYRGLKKNTLQIVTLFASGNLWMARHKMLAMGQVRMLQAWETANGLLQRPESSGMRAGVALWLSGGHFSGFRCNRHSSKGFLQRFPSANDIGANPASQPSSKAVPSTLSWVSDRANGASDRRYWAMRLGCAGAPRRVLSIAAIYWQ